MVASHPPSSPSKDCETFANLFLGILDHKVQHGDISLEGSYYQDSRERLKNVVQQAFTIYVNLHGALPRSDAKSLEKSSLLR
jgi:hypothetical protein